MLKLSRNRLRTLIWEMVDADDPVRHRWLQEHPHRDEIMNQLISDSMDLTIAAHSERSLTPTTGSWATVTETEIEPTVVEMVLGSPDLWEQVDEQFPRPTAPATREEAMHNLLHDVALVPRSGPTVNDSPRED